MIEGLGPLPDVEPTPAEQRLWHLMSQPHQDPQVALFVADTKAQIARCLGVTVDDLARPPSDLENWRPVFAWREQPYPGPIWVTLWLPDRDRDARHLQILRAWPGTAEKEWCLQVTQMDIRTREKGSVLTWYHDSLNLSVILKAANGWMPHERRGTSDQFRDAIDAYGRKTLANYDVLLVRRSLERLADRLAPEAAE